MQSGGGLQGGSGTVFIRNGARFFNNSAPLGANLHLPGATVYVLFPLWAGHWLPNAECRVNREMCPQDTSESALACQAASFNCSFLLDFITAMGSLLNTTTPPKCQPRTFIQPCNWMNEPSLLTNPPTKVYAPPNGIPIDDYAFPYECATGVLGSADPDYQLSALCGGMCPAGFYCPTVATTEAVPCPSNSYCLEGSASPTPCPAGTRADLSLPFMTSGGDCLTCAAGTSCAVGSTEESVCLPGSFGAHEGQSACVPCPEGEYQNEYGQMSCKLCTRGSFCSAGSSTPTPCGGGTYGNATGLSAATQCTAVQAGYWAPVGSELPIACPASGFYCPGKAADEKYGGARPVLIPVGQSTETTEVEAVTQQMALDVSMEDYNETSVKLELAALYGMPVELIDLSAAAGSLQLTITIRAAPPPTGPAAPGSAPSPPALSLAAILAAVQSVDSTAMAASMSSALGTNVSVAVQPPAQATLTVVTESVCPRGHWCSAGYVNECNPGTFNPDLNVDSAGGCQACPLHATSPAAATHLLQCACANGFVPSTNDYVAFDSNTGIADRFRCICPAGMDKRGDAEGRVVCGVCASGTFKPEPNGQETTCQACPQQDAVGPIGATSEEQCGCPAGQYKDALDASCKVCPIGARCVDDTVPMTLNLTGGRWRTDASSVQIETCVHRASCLGGINTSAYCAVGHIGPLCAVCSQGFRSSSTGGCEPCDGLRSYSSADVMPLVILCVLFVPLLIACCRYRRRCQLASSKDPPAHRAYREPPKAMVQRVIAAFIVKLKILTAHQQVLQGLSGVFRLTWPPAFKEMLAYLRCVRSSRSPPSPVQHPCVHAMHPSDRVCTHVHVLQRLHLRRAQDPPV